MYIYLENGEWHMNEYTINGDEDYGYFVYSDVDGQQKYSSMNFEDCLTFVYNS